MYPQTLKRPMISILFCCAHIDALKVLRRVQMFLEGGVIGESYSKIGSTTPKMRRGIIGSGLYAMAGSYM